MGKLLRKYWGLIAAIAVVVLWVKGDAAPLLLIVLSLVSVSYFAFAAPVWCGAITRQEQLCRRNASGILMGCSYRQHRWQKMKMAVVPPAWRKLNEGLWANPTTGLASLGAILGVASTLGGLVKLVA